jgi:hypothetical protein
MGNGEWGMGNERIYRDVPHLLENRYSSREIQKGKEFGC